MTQLAIARVQKAIRALPPGKTVVEVSQAMKITYQTARRLMRECGYDIPDGRSIGSKERSAKADMKYHRVNWSDPNVEIAAKLGVSRERVRQVRNELGWPRVESRGRKTGT